MPPWLPLAVLVLGCVVGLAVMACGAAFAALWPLLEPGEGA